MECPKRSLLIVGCNLLPTFGFNFAKYLTFCTNKQELITLSRTPRQHGPRSYPLYSSDSEHSSGKTLVFPQLMQFSVHKLSCQMNFYKMKNFQLTPFSKNFQKLRMFLPLLCLGTILALTCPANCQPSCSPPPSSGSVGAAWFHPFSRSTRSCAAALTPSPYESDRVMGWLPSAALRLARPRTPRLAARVTTADRQAYAQAVLPQPSRPHFRPAGFFTFSLIGAAMRWSLNHFPALRGEVFACPGPAVPLQPPQTWNLSRQRAPPKRLDL